MHCSLPRESLRLLALTWVSTSTTRGAWPSAGRWDRKSARCLVGWSPPIARSTPSPFRISSFSGATLRCGAAKKFESRPLTYPPFTHADSHLRERLPWQLLERAPSLFLSARCYHIVSSTTANPMIRPVEPRPAVDATCL